MDRYKDINLDVVSMSELKSLIIRAKSSLPFVEKEFKEINSMLGHIDIQLRQIGNERRSQLTLGEFISKYHCMNVESLNQYSSDLLKN